MHDIKVVTTKALPQILDWIDAENAKRLAVHKKPIRIVNGYELAEERLPKGLVDWLGAITPNWGTLSARSPATCRSTLDGDARGNRRMRAAARLRQDLGVRPAGRARPRRARPVRARDVRDRGRDVRPDRRRLRRRRRVRRLQRARHVRRRRHAVRVRQRQRRRAGRARARDAGADVRARRRRLRRAHRELRHVRDRRDRAARPASRTCAASRACTRPVHAADGVRRACRSTTISGTVTAPGHDDTATWGTPDPIYGALVYVPNGAAGPPTLRRRSRSPPASSCDTCSSLVSGAPLVSATTARRRQVHDRQRAVRHEHPARDPARPLAPPDHDPERRVLREHRADRTRRRTCRAITVGEPGDVRSDIPLMAVSTGDVDTLHCVLRKIGIADSEFTKPERHRPRARSTRTTARRSTPARRRRRRRSYGEPRTSSRSTTRRCSSASGTQDREVADASSSA